MLKHVQVSPMRNRSDSLSIRSNSSSSCSSSICGSPEPPTSNQTQNGQSTSDQFQRSVSRASSYCSLNESTPQTTIKIFMACLRLDIEYKTLGIQWDTTCKEVIAQLLRRCKMRQRDPRLFYLSMEVTVRRAGVRTLLVLDDEARPAILQACHPKGDSRYYLQLKPGGLIKVHTSVLQPTSLYKSILISEETSSDELMALLLQSYNSIEPVEMFSLYEVCPGQEYQRKLHPDDLPLRAQIQRQQKGEQCHFLIRKNPHYPRRRQLLLPPIIEQTSTYSINSLNSSSILIPTSLTASSSSSSSTIAASVTTALNSAAVEIDNNNKQITSPPITPTSPTMSISSLVSSSSSSDSLFSTSSSVLSSNGCCKVVDIGRKIGSGGSDDGGNSTRSSRKNSTGSMDSGGSISNLGYKSMFTENELFNEDINETSLTHIPMRNSINIVGGANTNISSTNATVTMVCKMCKNNFKSCEFCHHHHQHQHQHQHHQHHHHHNNQHKRTRQSDINRNSYNNTTNDSTSISSSPLTTSASALVSKTYNPVYNIREIRTVCNSFSSLGIDKKLLEVEHNSSLTRDGVVGNFTITGRHQRRHSISSGNIGGCGIIGNSNTTSMIVSNSNTNMESRTTATTTTTSPSVTNTNMSNLCSSNKHNIVMEVVNNNPPSNFVYI